MTKKERKTKQKQIIKNYLASTKEHPSAETIYNEVKKELPDISKATVYRILRNFKKKEEIQEIPTDISRWDYNEKPHPHFICSHCNKIFDIDKDINISEEYNLEVGKVENYRIVFCGCCKKCIKKVDKKL